jgi:hypothetical protein
MSEPPAVLRYGDRDIELPVVIGSEGEPLFIVALRVLQATRLVVPDAAHDLGFYARSLAAARIGNNGTTHRADIRLGVVDGAMVGF